MKKRAIQRKPEKNTNKIRYKSDAVGESCGIAFGKRKGNRRMEFIFRRAVQKDVDGIMEVMKEAKESLAHPEWFVADDAEYIRNHLQGDGFAIVAEIGGEIAGFFVVKKPKEEDNLGKYVDFSRDQCGRVWIMDTAAVAAEWRGNQLQSRMLAAAEKELAAFSPEYLMCTVHPDNCYSLHNMQKNGYQVIKKALCYGGLERFILMKHWKI